MKKMTLGLLAAAALFSGSHTILAQENSTRKPFDIGISAGMVLPGSINIGGAGVSTGMSPFFKAHFDAYIVEKLAMGVYATYLTMTMDEQWIPDNQSGASGFEIGATIKPCFRLSESVKLKPAVEFGYRNISPEANGSASVSGFGLNANMAFVFKAGSMAPFVAPGFISQPAGGNGLVDVTWAPVFTVAAGIEF